MGFGGFLSGIISKLAFIIPRAFGFIIVVAIIMFFVYQFILLPRKFPLTALLYERLHNSPVFAGIDSVGLKIDAEDGFKEYRLRRRKHESIQPVDYEFIIPSKKGRGVIHLLKVGDDSWLPIKVNDLGSTLHFDPAEIQLKNWWIQTGIRIRKQFQTPNWWKEHKSEVIFIMTIICCILMFYIMLKYSPAIVGQAKSIASSSSKLVGTVKEAINPSNAPI